MAATWNLPGPIYYRLGKDDKTTIPGLDGRFELGKVQRVREGSDLLMISMGSVSSEAAAAAATLEQRGVNCTFVILASVSPAPSDDLAELIGKHPNVLTVEAHYRNGGIGSLVAELIAERGLRSRLTRCAVDSMPAGITGSQRFLHQRYGLSSDKLVDTALRALKGSGA